MDKDQELTREEEVVQEVDALKTALAKQAREDEQPHSSSFSLRKILGGDILTADLFKKNVYLVALITVFILAYISSRYVVQKDILELNKLTKQLDESKYRALSSSSQLTEKSRESHVLEVLKHSSDSTLKIASQPPFKINVPSD